MTKEAHVPLPNPIVTLEDSKFELPDLSNYTSQGLIDLLGQCKDRKKNLEKYEGLYTQALIARLKEREAELNPENSVNLGDLPPTGTFQGEKYEAVIEPAAGQERLDTEAVKAHLGADYLKFTKMTNSKGFKLTVKRKD